MKDFVKTCRKTPFAEDQFTFFLHITAIVPVFIFLFVVIAPTALTYYNYCIFYGVNLIVTIKEYIAVAIS